LDILAARHPLAIGIVRSILNEHKELDNFVESYVRASMDQEKTPGVFESYAMYYLVMFNEDQVRTEIANSIEKKFGL
jgi:hypothetical protein